jgi:hypothetical protein
MNERNDKDCECVFDESKGDFGDNLVEARCATQMVLSIASATNRQRRSSS